MRRLIIIINLSLIVAFMMMFADCSDSSNGRKQVSIGYVNWSEGIAMSYLAKVMLESKGYDVMLRNAILHRSLSRWRPVKSMFLWMHGFRLHMPII